MKFYTVKEVAEILNLSPDTVYLKINAGELPHYKLDDRARGRIRISEKQLEEYLESRKNKAVKVKGGCRG